MAERQLPSSNTLKKTCTSCGTINTPQWREGPSGPRTLCNACGVKYLRHVRGLPRSSKLAAVHKPLKKSKQQLRASKKQPPFPKTSTTAKLTNCKGSIDCKQEPRSQRWHDNAEDCSQPSSESAGEVCWAHQAETCDQEQDLLHIGTECAAAVNLLSMTQSHSSLQRYVAGAPAFEAMFAEPPQAHGIEGQFRGSADASCARPEDRHKHAQCCAAAEFEVCIAKKEAAVADAAVAAVAKVLAAKQATAKTAKAAVSNADKRLKQLQAQAWEVL